MTITPAIAPTTADVVIKPLEMVVALEEKRFQSGQRGIHFLEEFLERLSHLKFVVQSEGHVVASEISANNFREIELTNKMYLFYSIKQKKC